MANYVPFTTIPVVTAKISDGQSVVVTAPAEGVIAGLFYLIGGWFGTAFESGLVGERVALSIAQNEYQSTQIEGSFTVGAALYWNAGTSRFTATVGTNRLVGRVTELIGTTGIKFILGPQV